MNKWFNKQKPITLGFITGISCFLSCYIMSYFTEVDFKQVIVIKLCGVIGTLTFFMSWLLFYMGEKSMEVFDEIESLYFHAKKAKTKGELIILESDYRVLRNKCQHQNHYAKMNEIWQILQTKREFL